MFKILNWIGKNINYIIIIAVIITGISIYLNWDYRYNCNDLQALATDFTKAEVVLLVFFHALITSR